MESLYRKYRPLTFESVVGQQHIVSTLEHAVAEGRLSHAYLFCGPRGTGKTTMARILAKSLLCEKAEAVRATGASGCNPDGTCPECEAIAEGTHPDVYELDAASRTGVDNVREEIINSVGFAPVRGAYKVYIIDEVHMLTTAAFNALLKTLEEPPSHVVFVLCTTDPQKILETILSRCQRFDFHRISNADIVGRLRYICEQEGFAFDDEALDIVARHARGGMRDALSTLEQLSVFGDGSVRADDARALLGEVASTVLAEFASAIAKRDVVSLFGLVRAQADEGNDILELTRDLVAHVRDVYTAAIAGPRAELFDGTPDEVAALVAEAKLFEGPDRLARALTVLDDAALEMRNASDVRLVLEIALTRLARPEADLTLEALAERLARLEAQVASGVPSAPMPSEQLSAMTGVPSRAEAAHQAVAPAPGRRAGAAAHASARPAAAVPAADAGAAAATAPAAGAAVASGVSSAAAPAPAGAVRSVPASAPAVPVPAVGSVSAAAPAPAVSPEPPAAPAAVSAPAPVVLEASGAAQSTPAPAAPQAASASSSAAAAPSVADAELQRRWTEAIKRVVAAQPSRGGLLQSSRAIQDDGETLTVAFPKGSGFALKMITRPDSHALVTPIICQAFGPRTVSYVMDGGQGTASAPAAPARAAQGPAPQPPQQGRATAPASPRQSVPTASQPAAPVAQQAAAPAVPQAAALANSQAAPAAPAPAPAPTPSAPAPAPTVPAAAAAPAPEAPASASTAPAPASAPAQASAPARPTPSAPAVDQVSGPSVLAERDIEVDRKAWEDEKVPYDDAMIASYADDDELLSFEAPAPTEGDAVDAKEVLQNIWGNVVFK